MKPPRLTNAQRALMKRCTVEACAPVYIRNRRFVLDEEFAEAIRVALAEIADHRKARRA